MIISLKAILSLLVGFSLLFPTCFLIWMPQTRYLSNSAQETHKSSPNQEFLGYHTTLPTFDSQNVSNYKFIRPQLAYKILMELDVEPQFDNNNMNIYGRGRANMGFKRDDSYCAKRQEYFAQNAALLFEEANIVNAYTQDSVPTTVVSSFASDLHYPNIQGKSQKQKEIPQYDMLPSTDSFFTVLPLHFFYDINKQCSCLSQMSNQIPGCGNLASKHKVSQAITTYMKKYQDRPQCLDYTKFFLQSWVLSDTNECKDFFGKLNSPEYERLKKERTIVFIRKISNTHRGEGVIPLYQKEETNLKNEYQNGALCGQVKKDIIMQNYIHNSLNLNGHKFDFRMYLLIASVNPLIAYYHDGFLRVSLLEYDATSNDKKVLLTNLALNKQIYDDAGNGKLFEGMNPEDLKEAQQWSFDKLQTYLLEKGLISDPNWLENYLRPEFKKALIHLVRLSSDQYVRHSSFYGLLGVDFMLDTDLKLWFIEANAGPAFDGYSQSMEKFISKMIRDHFEIVFGLLRSRMKRVVDFVNNLMEKSIAYQNENGTLVIREVDETKRIFKEITRNYFEKEFEVDKSNGFEKIIDENDIDIYQGLLDEKCL